MVARAHFEAIEVEDVGTVRLGDFVELDPEEDSDKLNDAGQTHRYVMQVKELFQDTQVSTCWVPLCKPAAAGDGGDPHTCHMQGVRMLDGHWFYKTWDTALRVRTKASSACPATSTRTACSARLMRTMPPTRR